MFDFVWLTLILSNHVVGIYRGLHHVCVWVFGFGCSRCFPFAALFFFGNLFVTWQAPDCEFSNLPWLIVVCHMVLPIVAIPLTFVLVPDIRLSDNIDIDSEIEDDAASDVSKLHRKGES